MTPFEAAGTLLACLESAFTGDAGIPGQFCQRPGDQVAFLFGEGVDDCCTGLAWVRVQSIDPVVDPVASEQPDYNPCYAPRRVTIEMGVARCNPSGVPTCEQWTQLAARMDLDATAMRRAACCARGALKTDDSAVYEVLGGAWTPLESSGGCAGGSMTVSVWIDCGEC